MSLTTAWRGLCRTRGNLLCRTLPDVRGWQQSGAVNLPNGRVLAIFTQRGVSRTEQNPQGIHVGPHVQYRDEGKPWAPPCCLRPLQKVWRSTAWRYGKLLRAA